MDQQPLKSTPGCPKSGWRWLRAVDLRDDEGRSIEGYEVCQFCGKEEIRFVHYLDHPDWKDAIAVGRICADELSGDPAIDAEERRLRSLSQRRANFPDLKSWKVSAKGNYWIEYQDHHIVVMPRPGEKYRLRIDGEFGRLSFPDKRAAMRRAFDVVMRKVHQGR